MPNNLMKVAFMLQFLLFNSANTSAAETKPLQELMAAAVEKGVPGLSVAVADKNGLIWSGTAGYSDIENKTPMQPDHLLGIGSITKTFVAVVILQLMEEQRLTLDQTAFEILGEDIVGSVPGIRHATIKQMLNHTSGIPSWEEQPDWITVGRGKNIDPSRYWGKHDTLPYVQGLQTTGKPGENYAYSNTNHTLLGLVIEELTGHSLVDEIQTRILEPLGIKDIYLEGFQDYPKSRITARYHYDTPEFRKQAGIHKSFKAVNSDIFNASASNLSTEWAAGGMVATARDLAIYAASLKAGKLLQPESMSLLQEWTPIQPDQSVSHGLFRRETENGNILIGHTGGVLGYTAAMHWLDQTDISIVVLTNIGVMHIGQRLPSAGIARDDGFLEQVLKYVQDYHSSN